MPTEEQRQEMLAKRKAAADAVAAREAAKADREEAERTHQIDMIIEAKRRKEQEAADAAAKAVADRDKAQGEYSKKK